MRGNREACRLAGSQPSPGCNISQVTLESILRDEAALILRQPVGSLGRFHWRSRRHLLVRCIPNESAALQIYSTEHVVHKDTTNAS
jgi:hypothetical protein